jgi:hypothetical protein
VFFASVHLENELPVAGCFLGRDESFRVGDSPVSEFHGLSEEVVDGVEGAVGLYKLVGEDEAILFTVVANTSKRRLGSVLVGKGG